MTCYSIKNYITSQTEYFVPTEEIKLQYSELICNVGGLEAAIEKAQQIKIDFLEQESYRFTVTKETMNGNDTTWGNADLLNDPEEGVYHVFNHEIGAHEKINGLSAAISRLNELKTAFINQFVFEPTQLESMPSKPSRFREDRYGELLGDIPTETM